MEQDVTLEQMIPLAGFAMVIALMTVGWGAVRMPEILFHG